MGGVLCSLVGSGGPYLVTNGASTYGAGIFRVYGYSDGTVPGFGGAYGSLSRLTFGGATIQSLYFVQQNLNPGVDILQFYGNTSSSIPSITVIAGGTNLNLGGPNYDSGNDVTFYQSTSSTLTNPFSSLGATVLVTLT